MSRPKNIAGVVLAGGRSSRMGRNKALLDYQGQPLIEYMVGVLKEAGLEHVLISGEVEGYECVPDGDAYEGPAQAMNGIMRSFSEYEGFLFVPVDMPLLRPEVLTALLQNPEGAYFAGCNLPAYIARPFEETGARSVKDLLGDYGIYPAHLPEEFFSAMANTNTPEEWREVLSR